MAQESTGRRMPEPTSYQHVAVTQKKLTFRGERTGYFIDDRGIVGDPQRNRLDQGSHHFQNKMWLF